MLFRSDAFRVKRFELNTNRRQLRRGKVKNDKRETRGANFQRTVLAFRMFRPPLRAIVTVTKGCPQEISAWDKHKSVYGKIVSVAGPWRTTGEWWRSDSWARDEWDVAVEKGRQKAPEGLQPAKNAAVLYRIYRELKNDAWFVEGVYD